MRSKLSFIGRNDLEGVEADAAFCVEHGFEGLEYNFWGNFRDLTRETVESMRELLEARGVRCAMLGLWGWNHLAADADERAESRAMLDRAIEFAALLEAEVFTTGAGQLGDDASPAENAKAFAEMYAPRLEKIEAAGMKPCLYPLHGNCFIHSMDDYERVWEHFPQIGVKFDPANWANHGDDYVGIVRQYGDRIGYLHVKEHLYHGDDRKPASQPAAGMGDIAWGKIFAFLYEHGYDAPLSIEPHGPLWGHGELRPQMLLLTQRHISQFLL